MWRSLSNTLDTLLTLQKAMDQAKNAEYFGTSTTSSGGHPPINIFEKEGVYMVLAELPGLQKEDIKVEIKENLLRIAGMRKTDYGKDISRHRMERRAYSFDRSLKLPFRVDPKQIKAEYENGLLAISLPQAEADKPKQIAIN